MRDFSKSSEPSGEKAAPKAGKSFVVQKHFASTLHYDFRLELGGTLKSWAVPKGPSMDPKVKRLAVQVEDHPVEYGGFEGEIPKGEYGAGKVLIWDQGDWTAQKPPTKGLRDGKLEFQLKGKKLRGSWVLVRSTSSRSKAGKEWLLMKRKDAWAKPSEEYEVTERQPDSVLDEILPEVPSSMKPQLATLSETAPKGKDWLHEVKWDGYRTLTRIENGKVQLFSRNAHDWTHRYEIFLPVLESLKLKSAWLDGEVVWLLDSGQQSFSALQKSFESPDKSGLVYVLFDLLVLDNRDLRGYPLVDRKEALKSLLKEVSSPLLRFSDHFQVSGPDFKSAACEMGLEGIVSKLSTASYQSGRSTDWLKIKCRKDQEFVVGGFTYEKDSRQNLGALLLGVYEGGKFRYAGKVGTGFSGATGQKLITELKKKKTDKSPFQIGKPPVTGQTHWARPEMVVQIKYSDITDEGLIRHGSFAAVRDDQPARQVMLDKPPPKSSSASKKRRTPAVKLTHPGRVVYDVQGLTKEDLFNYYEEVSEWILPHLKERPLALLRCPSGAAGECFFQKHLTSLPTGVQQKKVNSKEKDKKESLLTVSSQRGLLELVQLNAIEFHPWGSTLKSIDNPNLIVMDLDPGPEVSWTDLKDGALQLKELLKELGLKSYLKVTGGQGLHLHIPIKPQYGFDLVKPFARALAKKLVKDAPRKFTSQIAKSKRRGKIFVDYLRNGYGATAVATYSARARPAASVAMPLKWSDLAKISSSDQFQLTEAIRWLRKRRSDPWSDYWSNQQSLTRILDQLEAD